MKNKSWKTGLAGLLGGFLTIMGPTMTARLQGDKTMPPITTNQVAIGAALAALGYLSKDKDVTGGTRNQNDPSDPPTDSNTPSANFPTTR